MTASAAARSSGDRFLATLRWLALAVALALLTLAARPGPHVFDMPLTEDGYYSLTVARNLAAGSGLTIDGTTLTNGFQPLFTVIEGLAFTLAGANDALALRFVMAFAWAFHVAGALTLAAIARDAWPELREGREGERERGLRGALAAFLYLAAPLMLNHAYNGLETGCVMFFYALAWRWRQMDWDRGWGGLAGFGAVIGLMVLARIDAAFLALVLGLDELRRHRHAGFARMLARGVVLGGVALAVSSPWWIYNMIHFGSPMPTSGTAQQNWAIEWLRFEFAEWALRLVAVPWVFFGAYESAVSIDVPWPFGPAGYVTVTLPGTARLLLVIAAGWTAWRAWSHGTFRHARERASSHLEARVRRSLGFAACFAVALAGLFAYYLFSFVAYWFYYRYFAPAALFVFVVVAVAWARHSIATASTGGRVVQFAIAGALAVQIGVLAILARDGRGLGGNTVYHDQLALVRAHVPASDYVAAGQSGTLGFFRPRVVNTDGKVNLPALGHQDRMWVYLAERNIKWFVDWPYYVNKYLAVPLGPDDVPAAEANGWRRVATQNYFYLYEYVGPKKAP
jgi:hypothetical protein